ncbi:MAG: hypothetical protein N3F64_00310 [Nitrososphaeria archaeon]|nr:hypothetical protein [Nitrososphaeria archaeon]
MNHYDMSLEESGLIPKDKIEELKKENIYTCLQLIFAPYDIIKKYFNEKEEREILPKLEELFRGIYRFRKIEHEIIAIPTLVNELDNRIGGISSSQITEVCSEKRYLRSLFSYNLILNFIQTFENHIVIYNDSNQTFRPEKLCELSKYRGIKEDSFLDKIIVFKPYTIKQQIEILEEMERVFNSNSKKLLVIDEIGNFFKPNSKKKNIVYYNYRMLENFILRINQLSVKYNVITLLLNNLIKKIETNTYEPQYNFVTENIIGTKILLIEEDRLVRIKIIIGDKIEEFRVKISDYGISDAI